MRAVECSDARERIVPNRSSCSRVCLASTATSAWDQEAVLHKLQEGVSNSAMRWPERVCFSAWVGVSEMPLLWLAWLAWALVSAEDQLCEACCGRICWPSCKQKITGHVRENSLRTVGVTSAEVGTGGERGRRPSARPWAV